MMKKRIIALLLATIAVMLPLTLASCKDGKQENDMYLILVNKKNPVGESYVPENLKEVNSKYTTGGKYIQLEEGACRAALEMLDAMAKDGITNVTITSGYRDYAYQQVVFDRHCKDEAAAHPAWSEQKIKDYVLTYSAAPGTSEHQTGLCVDLFTSEMEGLWNYGSETPNNPYDKGFAETEAFEWLCDNAHKYGFVLRFPEDKTSITGYSYESWHYRYVGVEAAGEIHKKGITLEEYLDK